MNVASAGLTGVVADRVNRSGKPLGATAAFAWAAVATFAGYRNSPFTVEIDDERLDRSATTRSSPTAATSRGHEDRA